MTKTIGCGIEVHRFLGPGFKERIYERAFNSSSNPRDLRFECEKRDRGLVQGWKIPGQRMDLIVEQVVIVELKSVPRLKSLHERQLVSYLKIDRAKVGLLMNFNTTILKNGLKRVVCEHSNEDSSSRS